MTSSRFVPRHWSWSAEIHRPAFWLFGGADPERRDSTSTARHPAQTVEPEGARPTLEAARPLQPSESGPPGRDNTTESAGQFFAQQFAAAVRQCIQAEYPNPPEPPQDWSREGHLDCDCEFCTEVNEFLPKRDVSSIGIYKTLKGNLLHVESEAEKGQIEVDIAIEKVAPKFNGTIQKNQSRYERKRQLYDAAQGIIRKLPS